MLWVFHVEDGHGVMWSAQFLLQISLEKTYYQLENRYLATKTVCMQN
jgi:hypothetical protein